MRLGDTGRDRFARHRNIERAQGRDRGGRVAQLHGRGERGRRQIEREIHFAPAPRAVVVGFEEEIAVRADRRCTDAIRMGDGTEAGHFRFDKTFEGPLTATSVVHMTRQPFSCATPSATALP